MECRRVRRLSPSMFNFLMILSADSTTKRNCESTIEKLPNWNEEETGSESSDDDENEESQIFKEYKKEIFPWESHRFDKHPWSDDKRPYNRINLILNEDEENGILTENIISCCLTYLQSSPYDLKYALCKCIVSNMKLVDISRIRKYHYIQYLDLSSNRLTTLSALSEMPYLQYLDVSNNFLERLLDFSPPMFLSYVDYSHNKLKCISDLSRFWSVVHLDVSFNQIKQITGLKDLQYLNYLNLSHNRITVLENLNSLRLDTLLITNNELRTFENPDVGFKTMDYIRVVDFSVNKLKSLKFLEANYSLEVIIIADNDINDLMELYYLRDHHRLKILNVLDNKICKTDQFSRICIRIIKHLTVLNTEDVTAQQRIEAWATSSPLLPASVTRLQLLLLETVSTPNIKPHDLTFDRKANVLLVVGPPASKKKHAVFKLVEQDKQLTLGVGHTTRPKRNDEVHGKHYYFIDHDSFVELIRKGEFVAISEFNGYLYGIRYEELTKVSKSIIVFFGDAKTALAMRYAGISLTLVLALPLNEQTHLQWLKHHYFFKQNETLTMIEHCPVSMISILEKPSSESSDLDEEMFINDFDDESILYKSDARYSSNEYSESLLNTAYSVVKKCRDLRNASEHKRVSFSNESIVKRKTEHSSDKICYSSGKTLNPVWEKRTLRSCFCNIKTDKSPVNEQYSDTVQTKLDISDDTNLKASETTSSEENVGLEITNQIINNVFIDKSVASMAQEMKLNIENASVGNDYVVEHMNALIDNVYKNIVLEEQEVRRGTKNNDNILERTSVEEEQNDDSEIYCACSDKEYANAVQKPHSIDKLIPEKEYSTLSNRSYILEGIKRHAIDYELRKQSQGRSDNCNELNNVEKTAEQKERSSISKTEFMRNITSHFSNNPLLSALSAENYSATARRTTTKYSTVAERIDQVLHDKLDSFLQSVLKSRRDLLHLHWENPGLFSTVIFTDNDLHSHDTLRNIVATLRNQIKNIPNRNYLCENDILSNEIVSNRLDALNLEVLHSYNHEYNMD